MNVQWNSAASASQWANFHPAKKAETTGTVAQNHNNDPLFKAKNAETAGAVAMWDGAGSAGGHLDYAA